MEGDLLCATLEVNQWGGKGIMKERRAPGGQKGSRLLKEGESDKGGRTANEFRRDDAVRGKRTGVGKAVKVTRWHD